MSRNKLIKLSDKLKSLGLIDSVVRYNPISYNKVLRVIREMESENFEGRRAYSKLLTSRILKSAHQTLYGKKYGGSIEEWPILTKTELRGNLRKFCRTGVINIPASTGGTTGTPIQLIRSTENVAAEQVFIDKLLHQFSLKFNSARVAVLRANEVKDPVDHTPPYGELTHRGKRLVLSNAHLSDNTIGWFISTLNDFRPDILWVYPSMITNLILLMQKSGLSLTIPIVLTSSESLTSATYKEIERVFKAKIIDYYGQAERVCFAYSFNGNEYWFCPAYGLVELLKDQSSIESNGNVVMKIIATGYWNRAMPLIRYETEDYAIIPARSTARDIEKMCLGVKPFLGVAGRCDEYVISRYGHRIGGLNHLPREVKNILRLQVVQESYDLIVIKALTLPGFGDADRRKILTNAQALIPPQMNIQVEGVSELERRTNGKTPYVIRRV